MLNKYSILGGIVLVASLVYGSKAQAQMFCGGGYSSGHIQDEGYIRSIGCTPIQQQPRSNPGSGSGTRQVPDFKKEYGDGYIAVAWHPKATDVWASWNQRTNRKATQTVLNACTQAMGEGCGLVLNGWNGSAAFVRDRNNGLWKGWGDTPQQAREVALRSCQSSRQGCEVVHTFVSERLKQPNNFKDILEYLTFVENPASDVSKSYLPSNRGFLAIAWTGLSSSPTWPNLVVASGYSTLQEAEKTAIARCQSESKQTCTSFGVVDDRKYPLFAVYLHGQKEAYWYSNTTEKSLEKMADEHCRERGVACQKVGVFDARRSNVSIHPIKK